MLFAPEVTKVEPFARVSVPVVVVIVRPLMLVAVATPKTGVTKVGEVAKTIEPLPVVVFPSKVTVPDKSGKVIVRSAVGSVTARVVSFVSTVKPSKTSGLAPAISAPVRVTTPVEVRPTKEGPVAKTTTPVPVSSEMTPDNCAGGRGGKHREVVSCCRKGAGNIREGICTVSGKISGGNDTGKRPTPPANGSNRISSSVAVVERATTGAVAATAEKIFCAEVARLVPVATPMTGVPKVGEVAKTTTPVPVSSEITPANWADVVAANTERLFADEVKVPVVGKVAFVAPVEVSVMLFAPEVAKVEPFAKVSVPVLVVMVRPLRLVAVATPNTGVTKVGEVAKTTTPVPVSSEMTLDNCAEVGGKHREVVSCCRKGAGNIREGICTVSGKISGGNDTGKASDTAGKRQQPNIIICRGSRAGYDWCRSGDR